MKLHFLLCLFGLVTSVLASRGAGPYQIVLFWYIYRLEYVQYNGDTNTARGCTGHAPGGGCLFDEFCKWIQKTNNPANTWRGSTNIGTNLTPDVEDAVTQLVANSYIPDYAASKLQPTHYTLGQSPGFKEQIDYLMADVLQTRKDMAAAGIDESKSVELEEMRRAMIATTEARRAEHYGSQIDKFVAFCKERGCTFNIDVKYGLAADGESYPMLDTDKMAQTNPGQAENIRSAMRDYAVADSAIRLGDASHMNTIRDFCGWESDLLGPVPCG